MTDIESWKEDEQLRKSFYGIAIDAKKIGSELPDDAFHLIDELPRRITFAKGRDVQDYVFSVFKQENSSYSDAYFAMYSKRNVNCNSIANYLFSVCGSSFPEVLNKFLFIYNRLCVLRTISNRNWKSVYKNIDFSNIKDIESRFYHPL